MELPFELPEALVWLTSAGGAAWWCTMVSDYYRNNAGAEWFAGLSTALKQVVVYATMAVLPVAAYLVLTFVPQEFITAAAPHFTAAMTLLTAMLAARGVYELTQRRGGVG